MFLREKSGAKGFDGKAVGRAGWTESAPAGAAAAAHQPLGKAPFTRQPFECFKPTVCRCYYAHKDLFLKFSQFANGGVGILTQCLGS